jgi:hypothetical protein
MAKDDRQNSASQARVYKANAVHKRRAGKPLQARDENPDVRSDSVEAEVELDAVQGAETKETTESVDRFGTAADSRSGSGSEDAAKVTADAVEPAKPDASTASSSDTISDGEGVEDGDDGLAHSQEDGEADGESASAKRTRPKADPKTRAKRIAIAIVAILVISAVALASYLAWDRWGRYDDASDIQGQWYVEGTATSIVIDGQTMQLADDVAYNYEIDPQEKTIRFWFGSWEGEGRYRFSDDRQRLLIIDGQYSGVGNLFDDLFVSFDAMATVGSQRPAAASQSESAAAVDSGSSVEASSSGESQQATDQAVSSAQEAGQSSEGTSGLGKDVSLFNRQADPEALKAKEAAEEAARVKAEREAKAAAEAEAAEAAEYGYYDGGEEYDESSEYAYDEGTDEGDQSDSDDEEDQA